MLALPAEARVRLADAQLAYVSDYLSFAGVDEHGRVAFALDTNRGRDGAAFQAEHLYGVLHDEHRGWLDVAGTGRYANDAGALLELPSSPAFAFHGDPWSGLTVRSPGNGLMLEAEPVVERLRRTDPTTLYAMTSAGATLRWQGRVVRGRLIHEYLVQREANLLTRRSFSGLGQMEFHYLRTQDGDDLYVQSYTGGQPMAGMERLLGFRTRSEQTEQLSDLAFTTTQHDLALGLYRWPSRWRVTLLDGRGPAELTLRTLRRTRVKSWLVAGLAMSAVAGVLHEADGRQVSVHGFGELFATAPALLWDRLAAP